MIQEIKITFQPLPANKLLPGTAVKFHEDGKIFVIPNQKGFRGVWIEEDGSLVGSDYLWIESPHYNKTEYAIVGYINVQI
jgi:hypothetical protein